MQWLPCLVLRPSADLLPSFHLERPTIQDIGADIRRHHHCCCCCFRLHFDGTEIASCDTCTATNDSRIRVVIIIVVVIVAILLFFIGTLLLFVFHGIAIAVIVLLARLVPFAHGDKNGENAADNPSRHKGPGIGKQLFEIEIHGWHGHDEENVVVTVCLLRNVKRETCSGGSPFKIVIGLSINILI